MNRRQSMLPQESQPEVLVRGFHVPRSSPREDARNNSQTASTPNPHDRGPSGTPPQEAGRTERIDSHDHDASGLPPHAWYAPSRPGHQQDHPESSSSAAYREDLRLHADDPLPKNADRYARQLKQPLYKPFHTAPVAEPPEDHWFHPSNNPEHEWHENPYHMKWRYWKWKGSGPQQQQRTGDPTEERPIHASMCAVPAVVNDEEDWVDEEAVEGSEEEVGAGNQVEEAVSVSADEALFDSEEEIAWTSEDDDIEADTASKRGSFMLESARELIQNCTDTLVPKVFSSLGLACQKVQALTHSFPPKLTFIKIAGDFVTTTVNNWVVVPITNWQHERKARQGPLGCPDGPLAQLLHEEEPVLRSVIEGRIYTYRVGEYSTIEPYTSRRIGEGLLPCELEERTNRVRKLYQQADGSWSYDTPIGRKN